MNQLIRVKNATAIFFVALTCFGLSPGIRAVTPAPDGDYPGFNTAEGFNALLNRTTGTENTAIGFQALLKDMSGGFNTATGSGALLSNTTGDSNTANGRNALNSNTTGVKNTAVGRGALANNKTGGQNTATGFQALFNNTSRNVVGKVISGENNTANGYQALFRNTIGGNNTAVGFKALFANSDRPIEGCPACCVGEENTAIGANALMTNTVGSLNTAVGTNALQDNIVGTSNTAMGYQALFHNNKTGGCLADEGIDNSAFGVGALLMNDNGSDNTAIGVRVLGSAEGQFGNTAVGFEALANLQEPAGAINTVNNNIALGYNAGSNLQTGSHNIYIGFPGPFPAGPAEDFNTIRIGGDFQFRTFIAGISDVDEGGTMISAVYINSDGQLGTQPPSSSRRFKNDVKLMDNVSAAILALKPVTFHYKSDATGTPQFGLIAEEVAQVNPDLVVRDKNGAIYTVRYEAVNAMLLNEFLKEHRKVEKLQATVALQQKSFQSKLADQEKQIEALTMGLQKVSAQLEASKPTLRTVLNNQ